MLDRLAAAAPTNIGFPAAVDGDFRQLAPFLRYLLNNVGDPYTDPTYPGHVKDLEREVLGFFAELFRAPPGSGGYITSGGSEGNLHALWLARTRHPGGVVYRSTAAHYSIAKAARLLGLPTLAVATTPDGRIDYGDLRRLANKNRHRSAIVVANIGTTMTEAVDDVRRVHAALDAAGITDRYVHSDAALTGIPLALTQQDRPGFDLTDGADSIAVSGHKFLGTPWPCGVVLTGGQPADDGQTIGYTGSPDGTVSGSRNGHAALALWVAIQQHGESGLRLRAERAGDLADYTCRRLDAMGWPSWRNPRALTVVLRTPPPQVAARWPLATTHGWSHIMCMPGVTRQTIDAFLGDVQDWLAAMTVTRNATASTSTSTQLAAVADGGQPRVGKRA